MIDDVLDPRQVRELRAYAEGGIRAIDPTAIAEGAIGQGARRRSTRWLVLAVAATLLLAVAGVLAGGGAWLRPVTLTSYRGVIVAAGELVEPRGQPLLVTLHDGRVLIAGWNASPTTTAEVFDPRTGRSEPAGPMVSAEALVLSAASALGDGRVLLVGGARPTAEPFMAVAQVFDPATLAFAPVGPQITPRTDAKLAPLPDGRILMVGGTPPDKLGIPVAGAEIFDPVTETFSTTGALLARRTFHTLTALADGRVLVTGGEGGDRLGPSAQDVVEIYDPATGTFSAAADAPRISGWNLTVPLRDGRVVIVVQQSGPFDRTVGPTFVFDPRLGTFEELGSIPVTPGTATPLNDGRILLTGWWTDGRWTGIYDPATSAAQVTTGPSTAGWAPSAVRLADGRVLVVGGLEDGETHGVGGHSAPPVSAIQTFE
jgi:hypothetical protein